MVPLNFSEDDVTRVASNISGVVGALGAEVIELINCLICIGCTSEELMVIFSKIDDWMNNYPSPLVLLSRTNGLPPISAE